MAIANINGIKMWYEVTGEGAPVFQIHGCGFGHSNFAAATPILSSSMSFASTVPVLFAAGAALIVISLYSGQPTRKATVSALCTP